MTSKKIILLRLYLLSLAILLAIPNVHGMEHDKVIIPVKYKMLDDSIISREVHLIINGVLNDSLDHYKTKNHKNCIINNYRQNGCRFYTSFNDTGVLCTKDRCDLYQKPCSIIKSIRFFHVKYGLIFTLPSLVTLNSEIAKKFSNHFSCSVSAYSSKNRIRHYLLLSFESSLKKIRYLFIIKESRFYQCVVSE